MQDFDAVVVGGGIAGSTSAAALAAQGLNVLVCEAGLPSERRLAGELLHPPGAGDLQSLDLLQPLIDAGAFPVYGFVLFRDAEDPGTILSYSEILGGRPTGVALEHAVLAKTLLDAVSQRQGITVWDNARVLDASLDADVPKIRVRNNKTERIVEAPLVVSAEGRKSSIRQGAGIECRQEPPFRMVGWKVQGARLPYPGYGHLFIGGETPTLAYQMAHDQVRVMFELPMSSGLDVPEDRLTAIPEPFRSDLSAAMVAETRQSARFCVMSPERYTGGRLAIVGDAGGCVHPLIASGMSFCVNDAHRLAQCIGPAFRGEHGIEKALSNYDRQRRLPMLTRTMLGPALVEALSCSSPEMRLLRHGLFRYWDRSSRGRSVSMSLLSTQNTNMADMAREYALVCAHSLTGISKGVVSPPEVVPALVRLAQRTTGFVRNAVFPV